VTAAEIQAQIDVLEARVGTFAGATEVAFGDQINRFSVDQLHTELARLKNMLAAANSTTGSTTRFAATSKGF
jgi:hypothetical protein